MKRSFVVLLTASMMICVPGISKAETWSMSGYGHSLGGLHGNLSPQLSSLVWPQVNHEPAITKTLRSELQTNQPPIADYQYEWQHQAPLTSPPQAAPQFSYPQQGYYPREGHVPQAPGYEYDFGKGGTYPPQFPLEGASWRDTHRPQHDEHGHAVQPFAAHSLSARTHIGCLHW